MKKVALALAAALALVAAGTWLARPAPQRPKATSTPAVGDEASHPEPPPALAPRTLTPTETPRVVAPHADAGRTSSPTSPAAMSERRAPRLAGSRAREADGVRTPVIELQATNPPPPLPRGK